MKRGIAFTCQRWFTGRMSAEKKQQMLFRFEEDLVELSQIERGIGVCFVMNRPPGLRGLVIGR
jgi:hypothetical protein